MKQTILVISDLHAPYTHKDAVPFLKAIKKKYSPTEVILTGDECFPPEIEILTEDGFVRFDQLGNQKVAQWNEDYSIDFVAPLRKIEKDFSGELLEYRHSSMVSRTTPKHNLVKISTDNVVHRREAWDYKGSESWKIPRSGNHDGSGCTLTDNQIRLMVAFQADGTFTKGAARFAFTKVRKAERLEQLLLEEGIQFNRHIIERGDLQFYIEKGNVPTYFTKEFNIPVTSFSLEQKKIFIKELELWDGTKVRGGFRYGSIVKSNVEYISMMGVLSGLVPSKIAIKPGTDKHSTFYFLDFRWNREKTSLQTAISKKIPYNGKVYCVTVPSGMIVVRQDGFVSVSGNCDYHNISFHDSDPDLDSAGTELEKAIATLEPIYKLFPEATVLESNHGSLVYRKALANGLSRAFFKSYNDILTAPDTWKWVSDYTVNTPLGKVYFHHSRGPALRTSQLYGMSHVCGHLHESFNISYWSTPEKLLFAMTVGCLVDNNSLAMAYNKINLKKPIIGVGVIVNGIPELIPMVLAKNGRWVGRL